MKFYKTIQQSVLSNLSPAYQKKGIWIIVLMVFNATLDFFSVAAFIPLMAIIIDPDFVTANRLASKLYGALGFTTHTNFVIAISGCVLIFVLLKNIISLWIARAKANYVFNVRGDLSSRALLHHMQSSFVEFTRSDFTRVLNSINIYPLTFTKNIILSITTIISESLVCLFLLIFIAFYDYKIILLIIVILIPIFIIFSIRKKHLKKISHALKNNYPKEVKYASQMVEGFVEINAYHKTPYFYQRFQKISQRLTAALAKDQTMQTDAVRFTEIVIAFVICSLIIYSAAFHLHYRQTLVLMGIYAGASFRMLPSINKILHALQQIRTNEYLFEEFKIPLLETQVPHKSNRNDIIFNESITLKDISFRYPDGPQILYGISLTIHKGERVAITGASGEGKTTLLLLILGFLHQAEGELLVDGKTIHDKYSWQNLIGYIPQSPYILDGTIAENIAFGVPYKDIDHTKVRQLIKNLGLEDVIDRLPDGLDTRIGERGVKLSGGQRQRLAIARALYIDTDILLFDEITNQVHEAMELEIMNLLNFDDAQKKTIIMVTHQVPANFFNAVYQLQKGNLYERSTDV